MKFLLSTNRSNFNKKYRAGLSSNVYIPLNSGRYVGPDNNSSIFKTRPDTDSVNLADWITNQVSLGNITVGGDSLYSADGTISTNRTVTISGTNTLTFDGTDREFEVQPVISIQSNPDVDSPGILFGDGTNTYGKMFFNSAYGTRFDSENGMKLIMGVTGDPLYLGDTGTSNYVMIDQPNNEARLRGNTIAILQGGVGSITVETGLFRFNTLPTYADNAAAIAGGLLTGHMYKTATGEVRVRV